MARLKSVDLPVAVALRALAWLVIIISAAGAWWLWVNMAYVPVEHARYGYQIGNEVDPMGAAIAVGALLQGLIFGIALLAASIVVNDLRTTRDRVNDIAIHVLPPPRELTDSEIAGI